MIKWSLCQVKTLVPNPKTVTIWSANTANWHWSWEYVGQVIFMERVSSFPSRRFSFFLFSPVHVVSEWKCLTICEANSPFQALRCFHLIFTHPVQALSPGTFVLSKLCFLLCILFLILPTNGTQHLDLQYTVSGWSLRPVRLVHIVSHQVWVGAGMWTIDPKVDSGSYL